MKLPVIVLCEERNEYVSGKGQLIKQRLLSVHDCTPHLDQQIAASMSYEMTDDEKNRFPVGSLNGLILEIGVSRMESHNGKVKIRGALPAVTPKPAK